MTLNPLEVAEPATLVFLLVIAAFAGLVDAAIGGGGLIQLPGLFGALPGQAPGMILGTNKFVSCWGTASACWRFARQVRLPWKLLSSCAVLAFIGAYVGARLTGLIPKEAMRPIILVLMILMWIYTWRRPGFGQNLISRELTRRDFLIGLGASALIGFYDGIFGPGTGSFFIFGLVRFLHFEMLLASACAKVLNLATNLAALCYFIPSVQVLYACALPMAVANMLGAQIGSRLALEGGNQLLRRLFLGIVLILIVKLAWDGFVH